MSEASQEESGPRLICSNCAAITPRDDATILHLRPTAIPGIDEVGLRCPHCAHFFHIGYEDAKTRARRKRAENANHPVERERLRKSFTKFYTRYQAVLEARLRGASGGESENGKAVDNH